MHAIPAPQLQLLLLAGGLSTRMGQPKHLLPLPDGRPLFAHMLEQIAAACPKAETLHISLRQTTDANALAQSLDPRTLPNIQIIYDDDSNGHDEEPSCAACLGPSAGLIAAHNRDPASAWLVIACDYPLVTTDTIQHLIERYAPPVTCFQNAEGFVEPLLGIWSPEALCKLQENVRKGKAGPNWTVRELGGSLLKVEDVNEGWLWNANTPEEWAKALKMMHEHHITSPKAFTVTSNLSEQA